MNFKKEQAKIIFDFRREVNKYTTHILTDYDTHQAFLNKIDVILAEGVNGLQIFFTNCFSGSRVEFSSVTEVRAEIPWICPARDAGASLFQ